MGLQSREYIRETPRPLELVGDVGVMPGAVDNSVALDRCRALESRVSELEAELAVAKVAKIKELQAQLKRAEQRAQDLHISNLTRPETEQIARNVMAMLVAIVNLPPAPADPLADDRQRQILCGIQQLGQECLSACGAAAPFPAAKEAYALALRAYYGQCSKRDTDFLTKMGLIYKQ